MIINYKLQL